MRPDHHLPGEEESRLGQDSKPLDNRQLLNALAGDIVQIRELQLTAIMRASHARLDTPGQRTRELIWWEGEATWQTERLHTAQWLHAEAVEIMKRLATKELQYLNVYNPRR